ncbi:MAG: PKD domain-containing protein, partial [Bradymonadia bacterium]
IVIGEGTCLSLSVEANTGVTVASRTSDCEQHEPSVSDWSWDMGDGVSYQGEHINHRYDDQGTYLVRVTQTSGANAIRSSVISVLVQNEPPQFASSAFPLARAGEIYETTIRVTDPGLSDDIQVQLLDTPSDMTISQVEDGIWSLTWFVPLNAAGPHDIVLVAVDGHETADGFERDGGRSEFQFRLYVEPVIAPEMEMEPPVVEPGTLAGGGAGCNGTSTPRSKSPLALLLFGLFLVGRLRSFRS